MENRKFLKYFKKSICFSFLLILSAIFFSSCKKTVKIAFCDLPENICTSISEILSENQKIKYKINYLSFSDFEKNGAKKISKKNDLIFGNDGNFSKLMLNYSTNISEDIYSNIPDRIVGNNTTKLPVLLNHYGISYCDSVRQKLNLKYPGSFYEFEEYLENICKKTDYPLFVAGGENENLLAFITALCESLGGKEGYDAFTDLCQSYEEDESFNNLLNRKIYKNYYFADVLEIVSNWQKKGYLTKSWLTLKNVDFKAYARDYDIGCAFLSLDQYHSLNYKIAQDYSCDRFPVENFDIEHGLIAPEIVCFCTKNTKINNEIVSSLVSAEVQKELSQKTMLAPAGLNGTAYDRICDDVRFLASSCEYGPLPDCYKTLSGNNYKMFEKFIEETRTYLKR